MSEFDEQRRRLLLTTARAGVALVIGFHMIPLSRFARGAANVAHLPTPNAFLVLAADESVTVRLAHSEMGQGIWTTLPMLIAEELDCAWQRIRVEHAPTAPIYGHTAFGLQMTLGSSTTWSEFDRYRQVGAMARQMLLHAAAARWEVTPGDCYTEAGFVICGSRKLSYGRLAASANARPTPREITLKPPKNWKIIGKPTRRIDSPDKVTGIAGYGMDMRFPGLQTALVLRSPVFGAKLDSCDATRALAVPGVHSVVEVPSGIAVVATHFWAAKTGREALDVRWTMPPNQPPDSGHIEAEYRCAGRTPGAIAATRGAWTKPYTGAKPTIDAEFDLPYLAHAAMEPLNCTVRLDKASCEVWLGTQFQTVDQQAAAEVAGLQPSQVTLHTPFLGGGFGRRATPSSHVIREAVAVAKAAGVPVKVVWTREDDMRGGYYRPQWYHHVVIHSGPDGLPERWDHDVVGQSIMAGTLFEPAMVKNGVDSQSVEGLADSPYLAKIPTYRIQLHSVTAPVPVLWWRSVGHSHTAFVVESVIDELAHHAGQDPVVYRRRLLADQPRHLGVLELAAAKAAWGAPLPDGVARGVAVHACSGAWVAQIAEVALEGREIRVRRVVCAVDCGTCVNPAGVRAQMESGIVFGLSAALFGRITFKAGQVQQSNFHDYPVLRLHQMPRIEVHIVPSTDKPGGAGEGGTPPIAPAVANAVFALTKQRLRRLPFHGDPAT